MSLALDSDPRQGLQQPGAQRPTLFLDVSPLIEDQWTGIPVFTSRLARALLGSNGCELRFAYEGTVVPDELVRRALDWQTGSELRSVLDDLSPEVRVPIPFHSTLLYPSVKPRCGLAAREASVIHDLSTIFMPEFHDEANVRYHLAHFGRELATNDITFFVSEASRDLFLNSFCLPGMRHDVLLQYVDWPEAFPHIAANDLPLALPRYFVLVGTLEPRKNIGVILRAMADPRMRRLHCYVIGRRGWKVDEFLAEADRDGTVRTRVTFTGFISEYTKYRLIAGAEFLAFPSVYEGFGIPALEALSLGVPVVAAASSSLVEVVGEGGTFFDPFSVEGFINAVRELAHRRKQPDFAAKVAKAAGQFGPEVMVKPVLRWLTAMRADPRNRTEILRLAATLSLRLISAPES